VKGGLYHGRGRKRLGTFFKRVCDRRFLGSFGGYLICSKIIEDAKHQATELKEGADRYLSEARQKAKEILARGEKKEGEASGSAKDITGGRKV
jgi:hypothetical protein